MRTKLSFSLVLSADGTVDVDASLLNAETAIHEAMASATPKYTDDQIKDAIDSVFAQYSHLNLAVDAVIYGAVRNLGEDPLAAREAVATVRSWFDARCDKDGCDTGKPFVTRRGRGGVLKRGVSASA